ncbi:MAG TPA: hypothetical protein P5026_11610 [Kiritimatiellia bacterium]|nr:hypothetical protein [Kiritimatiellia bacterium]HRU71500.1 hypothetical protein [Kiritimatiellia bacterium]
MSCRFTVNIWAASGLSGHRAALEALARLVETGDGPVIHPVLAGRERDEHEEAAAGAGVAAVILRPEWSGSYINTQARIIGGRHAAAGRLVALLGVPRRRLAPDVQAMARWVLW